MKVKSASKSRLGDFEKCPLMAYKKLRDPKPIDMNFDLQVGNLAHELAEKKIADFAGINFQVNHMEERFPLVVIDKVLSILEKKNIESYYNDFQVIGIEESFSIPMPEVSEDFMLTGRFDVISMADINDQKYIIVDDLKSGANFKKEVDTEAIVYAYAASEKYGGLPVIFRKIALASNAIFTEEFSRDRLMRLKPALIFKLKEYKEDMESEMIPDYTPGDHCVYCPYLSQCQGRKDLSSLNKKIKAATWAKQYAKKYESEVKSAAKEILENVPTEDNTLVLVPFLNGRYGAVSKISESWGLKKRDFNKKDIINLLIETGEIENFVDNLDIKFDERLASKISHDFEIPTKRTVRQTISIVEKNPDFKEWIEESQEEEATNE